jgi:hypothetical protein
MTIGESAELYFKIVSMMKVSKPQPLHPTFMLLIHHSFLPPHKPLLGCILGEEDFAKAWKLKIFAKSRKNKSRFYEANFP